MSSIPLKYKVRAMAGSLTRRRMRASRADFLNTARRECRQTQRHLLQNLLRLNEGSQFSLDHGLKSNISLQEFRMRIPVSDYELVRPYIQRVAAGEHSALLGRDNKLLMFAVTSGTTADSKLIPVTQRFLSDYRNGWQMWGIGAYSEHQVLQKLNIVQISSSHRKFETPGRTPCGSISGLVATMQNPVVRTLYTVPSAIAEINDPDAKRYSIMRLALADSWVGMLITANPSTLIQLLEDASKNADRLIRDIQDGTLHGQGIPVSVHHALRKSLAKSPQRARTLERVIREHGHLRPSAVWPMLGLLGVWCGGSAAAYIPRLKQLFGHVPVRDHGLHASEGRMTLPLKDDDPAGILETGTHYFEFIPVREIDSPNPVVLEADELETGEEYFILLTTSSGLYRYNIRDVVRCVDFYGVTPVLEFRHKGAHISSITGEKLAESQIVDAVRATSMTTGLSPEIYTLTPHWGDPPGYTLFIGIRPEDDPQASKTETAVHGNYERFAAVVDSELQRRNIEYREKRESGRLQPIKVVGLPGHAWKTYTSQRQLRTGGSAEQYKHPCLVPDPQFEKTFLKACGLP